MKVWKKLKKLFKSKENPYLEGDGINSRYPNLDDEIAEMKAEADVLDKEVRKVENRIIKTIKRSMNSDS